MSLYTLALGNDYRGTSYELPDCVIDAERMFARLEPYLALDSKLIRNEECTLATVVRWLHAARKRATPQDAFVLYYSGHGTSDGKKQGLVLHGGTVLWEAKLRELLRPISPAILIADCCFAGGLARHSTLNAQPSTVTRYVPLAALGRRQQPAAASRMANRKYDYFAACNTNETAASTGHGGAFTNALLDVLRMATPRLSMRGVHTRVRKLLPNADYPQTPQFVASDRGFSRRTLGSFTR